MCNLCPRKEAEENTVFEEMMAQIFENLAKTEKNKQNKKSY